MIYRHRFMVPAALEEVAAFHRRAGSLALLTPPPLRVQFRRAPSPAEGAELEFTLWLGPLPLHWLARIENLSPTGFSDRQLRGPFAEWLHRHEFVPLAPDRTEVRDEIHFRLSRRPHLWLTGLALGLGLPLLFAFRAFKTKRILR